MVDGVVAAGRNPLGVIKVVREVKSLGFKEAKDLVEGAPSVLNEKIDKEAAERVVKSLAEAGAEVEIR
jgi:large subunit ribosomal protein L7/L12